MTVLDRLSLHPLLLDPPAWPVESPWNVHFAFGLLLVDRLRPARIIQLGLGDGALYHTLCQAVSRLELPTRTIVIEPAERALNAAASSELTARYAGFASVLRSGYVDTAETFAPGSVDLLVWNDGGSTADAEAALAAWLPRLSERGVVVYHPIYPGPGMTDGWQHWHRLRGTAPHLERLNGSGLGVLLVGTAERERLDLLRDSTSDEGKFVQRLLNRLSGEPVSVAAASASASPAPLTADVPVVLDGEALRAADYFLKRGYVARERPAAYEPTSVPDDLVNQPDVYASAAKLARAYGCTHIIDLGVGKGDKIPLYLSEFEVIGVDVPELVERNRAALDIGWIAWDFDQPEILRIAPEILRQSVIICADVIEHLVHPEYLLATLRGMLEHAPAGVISTPDRDRARGFADFGPPANGFHVREWNLSEFERLLRAAGLRPEFTGYTRASTRHGKMNLLSVLLNPQAPSIERAPDDFRVTAIVPAYNESDVLGACIHHLIEQGLDVYHIDNWSQDDGFAIASAFLNRGVIGAERFPAEGRGEHFEWARILDRIVQVSRGLTCDWVVLCAADQVFESPWPGFRLKDAIYWAHRGGWSIINHSMMEFRPVDESFIPGSDPRQHFKYWEWGNHPAYRNLHQCWRQSFDLDFGISGGHALVSTPDQIAPFHHIIRHYTHRSEAQGRRKLLERTRNEMEHARDWGSHNIHFASLPRLTRDPLSLIAGDADLQHEYLTERLFSTHLLNAASAGTAATPSGG